MFTNEIRPYQSNAYQCEQTRDALSVAQMGVLDVESGGFQCAEGCFDFPTSPVGGNSVFGSVEADEDLKLRHAFGIFDPAASKIDVLPLVKKEFIVEFLLSRLEGVEQPPCPYSFTGGRLDDPEVLSYTDIITDSVFVEPSNPLLADELAVSHKTIDTITAEKPYEALHDGLAFFPAGVAPLVQKTEHQRECNSFIGDTEHEDIDVEIAELPVGAVHAQNNSLLDGEQREYHARHQIKAEGIMGDEALYASQVGIPLHSSRHRRGKLVQTHGLHHAQGVKYKSHEPYTGQIHRISKMLLHNWEDLVNFDQVLGISNLHRKSCELFFKVTEFQGLLQI